MLQSVVISTPCIYSEAAHEAGPIIDLTNEVYIDGVATIDGEPVLSHEPVIHPGGSQGVDYNKVSHVGVHTVVQVNKRLLLSRPLNAWYHSNLQKDFYKLNRVRLDSC